MFPEKSSKIILALGSNASDDLMESYDLVRQAIKLLLSNSIKKSNISKYYQTPAFPLGAGPDFINCVLVAETTLMPDVLMNSIHAIEAELGRVRIKRWGQRRVDIDLLYYDDLVKPDEETYLGWQKLPLEEQMKSAPEQLILPHPRIQDRGFVLVPMADVAPDWRHPVSGKTTIEMRDLLPKEQLLEVQEFQADI